MAQQAFVGLRMGLEEGAYIKLESCFCKVTHNILAALPAEVTSLSCLVLRKGCSYLKKGKHVGSLGEQAHK